MPIPLMSDAEMERATARNKKLWAFIKRNKWTYEDVLRALFCYVLKEDDRKLPLAIDWIEDLLGDLRGDLAGVKLPKTLKAARKRRRD